MRKSDYPSFDLGTYNHWFDEQCYVEGDSAWLVTTLWKEAKKLPTYEVPLIALATDHAMWDGMNFLEFCSHVKLVNEADLECPIILTPTGSIADGRHRLAKAIIQGDNTIKVQRLISMPDPDFAFDDEGNTIEEDE